MLGELPQLSCVHEYVKTDLVMRLSELVGRKVDK